MENILEVKNLRKEYKAFTLNDISFDIPKGYIMGFIGPNGAGKSTTIKLIMNLLNRDKGDIKVFGLDNIKHEKEIKNKIGFVYDDAYFYTSMSIEQMKNIIAPFYKYWSEVTFKRYLQKFNLNPKQKIKELSKGMKTKFQLALALSHNAELIIMDEPTSGLDPIFRREILDILYDLIQDEQKSVFFSTHITSDLDKIADYITFINNGSIVFSSTKDDILSQYGLVKGSNELLNEKNKELFVSISKNSFGFEGLCKNTNEVKTLFKDRVLIEKPSLEDIMFYTVRG